VVFVALTNCNPDKENGGVGVPHEGAGTQAGIGFSNEKFPNIVQVTEILEKCQFFNQNCSFFVLYRTIKYLESIKVWLKTRLVPLHWKVILFPSRTGKGVIAVALIGVNGGVKQ